MRDPEKSAPRGNQNAKTEQYTACVRDGTSSIEAQITYFTPARRIIAERALVLLMLWVILGLCNLLVFV